MLLGWGKDYVKRRNTVGDCGSQGVLPQKMVVIQKYVAGLDEQAI